MPVFGARVHTQHLVAVGQMEDGVVDEKTMSDQGVQQTETAVVTLATPCFPITTSRDI